VTGLLKLLTGLPAEALAKAGLPACPLGLFREKMSQASAKFHNIRACI
jgi:hypothetical protein